PKLRTLSVEWHEKVQPLTGVGIRHCEQRGIGDVQIRLIERDLSEILRMLLLEPGAFDFSPARALHALMLPDQGVNHVGALKGRTMNDDAISMSGQGSADRGEGDSRRRGELKSGRDEKPTSSLLEVVPAIENLARPSGKVGLDPPIILNAPQTFVADTAR